MLDFFWNGICNFHLLEKRIEVLCLIDPLDFHILRAHKGVSRFKELPPYGGHDVRQTVLVFAERNTFPVGELQPAKLHLVAVEQARAQLGHCPPP